MSSFRVLQLLFLLSNMTSQMIGMMPHEISMRTHEDISLMALPVKRRRIEENLGIAQKIAELPKEVQYKIFSSALALRENPKYEVYKKFYVGSVVSAIALNADNTRALTGSSDGVAHLWDVKKGIVLKELKGHTGAIRSVALSADGTLALTGSWDGTARVWNILTGQHKTLQLGHTINSVALSADGSTALIGSNSSGRLYTSTGELLKELKGHKDGISSVALSADGTLALTSSRDGKTRVWNILTEKSILLPTQSFMNLVALSANGTSALTTNGYNKVLVWDAKSGTLLNTLLTTGLGFGDAVALSKDGKRALVSTHDNKIQVWNTKPLPGQKETSTPLTVLEDHAGSVTALAFGSADFIASGSTDGTALIWKSFALEPRSPLEHEEILRQAYKETFSRPLVRPTKEIEEGLTQRVEETPKEVQYAISSSALALRETPKYEIYKKFYASSIALNADNTRALTGSDNLAHIWDVEKGTVIKELKGHRRKMRAVALSADGTLALTCSNDATTRVWDILTGKSIILRANSISSVGLLSADGTLALIRSNDGIARLYTSTGQLLKILEGHTDDISSVALSADGTLALTGSHDGTARVWNINAGETIRILEVGSYVTSVALSADGTSALTASGEKVLVWDVKTGALLNTLLTNSPYIYSVALSKDGKRALVSTHDKKIQVWNTQPLPGQKETSTPLTVLEGHKEPVTAVAFGGDNFIASSSNDNTALIWKPIESVTLK